MSTEDQMSIEDRVRTATRARASMVRDIRPLAAPGPARLRRRPAPAARRWRISGAPLWGAPLGAVAAVLLVALSLVAVRQFRTPAPSASQSGIAAAPATVPRYYAVLNYDARQATYTGPLIVGDDLTGQVIDTISPPPGLRFVTLRGTSDDRTFVVLADSQATPLGQPPYTWYLLRIAPGTAQPYQLTKLAIKLPVSSTASAYALSPDGRELAIESLGSASSINTPMAVALYAVSSGAKLRAWTTPTNILSGLAQGTLSWLADGRRLVFSVGKFGAGSAYTVQLRALSVTSSGTNLMAASQALLTVSNSGPSTCESLRATPDGKTAICATQYSSLATQGTSAGCAKGGLKFTAYSVRTGQPVRVLYQYRGACHNGLSYVLWTDASARSIIGATEINLANKGGKRASQLGVITDGHLRPLKISKSVLQADYRTIAF